MSNLYNPTGSYVGSHQDPGLGSCAEVLPGMLHNYELHSRYNMYYFVPFGYLFVNSYVHFSC